MATPPTRAVGPLRQLERLLERARQHGRRALLDRELLELPRLYRAAATHLSQLETTGGDEQLLLQARALVSRAHALLHRGLDAPRAPWPRRAADFLLAECPRALRAEWRLLLTSCVLVYGCALGAGWAVSRDLDLAWSLLDPAMVASELEQLESTPEGEPFRGNFTFGLGESPQTSALIMTNNVRVGVLFFAAGLVPPLFLYALSVNGLMLGTYTAVAGHYGRTGEISSILWCHGVLEIQALLLAGAAGLVLTRGWVAPGPRTRRRALQQEGRRAWRLLAPVFPLLVVAGLIEGFVSPHAPLALRLAVAAGSGAALLAWALLGGRARAA